MTHLEFIFGEMSYFLYAHVFKNTLNNTMIYKQAFNLESKRHYSLMTLYPRWTTHFQGLSLKLCNGVFSVRFPFEGNTGK